MNVDFDYAAALEKARMAAEAAREKAKIAKEKNDKEQAEFKDANAKVDQANKLVESQNNIYVAMNEKLVAKQGELDKAMQHLNSLAGTEDEEAIAKAQAEVDRIKSELETTKAEAEKEYNELVKLQQDAETAIKRAEIEKNEAIASEKELEIANKELEEAEEALEEAEEAARAAEMELAKEVTQLTEEEAIKQGYTVIKTVEDLQAVRNNLSGKYILMNDIDLSGVEWEPIGQVDPTADDPWGTAFSGELNGNGFTIKNLTVKVKEGEEPVGVGLFGATNGANIHDVKLANIDVSAPDEYNETAVGGLIGVSRNTNVDNVSVTGNISGHQAVGGLIGLVSDTQGYGESTISNVKTNVDVDAAFYAGGLIGKVDSTVQHSLMIDNCHTSGKVNVTDSAGGGLIGEAGKTIITINNCTSSADITRESDLPSELSWLLDSSRIGGMVGNCNGTYITVCNSEYTGTLTSDDEFKGDVYGWYMNDAQISIYDIPGGLPIDDILNIDGIESLEPIVDQKTGLVKYIVQVSTLAGMNKIVDMIQNNPKLGEIIDFKVNFDFEQMDEEYDNSAYSQYGVVQHIHEDEEGNVVNDVYIDNEIDLETTFNAAIDYCDKPTEEVIKVPKRTMVDGLFKDDQGRYYIYTPGSTKGDYENFTEVNLEFFFENQKTIISKRLDKDQVKLREYLVESTHRYQHEAQKILAERYGIDFEEIGLYIIEEPEYKNLKKKEAQGVELTKEEKLKIELFELNYTIANIVADATKNKGCGMGGDASFLEETTGIALEDEWGRIRYMDLEGTELRQKVDENGELMVDKDGNPVYETLDGAAYNGNPDNVFVVRGFPVTNEEGAFLYTDSEGKTVLRTENEDGTYTYAYEDGTPYEGDPEELTQQLEEQKPTDILDEVASQMEALVELYENGGSVDPGAENYGIPTEGATDGETVGETVGATDGETDEATDEATDGATDGETDGATDGATDEATDGISGGESDGESENGEEQDDDKKDEEPEE